MDLFSPLPSLEKPKAPLFGSGPTRKFPGWTPDHLSSALLGRSHRSSEGHERLHTLIRRMREVLDIPPFYEMAIVAGSATGAIESALWNFLGQRGVDVFSWDIFGKLWVIDIINQLKIPHSCVFEGKKFGEIPDFSLHTPSHDVVFTWNGTTAGACVPHLDWISSPHPGLVICDATSAAFAIPLPWEKLDVTAFSWQKGLGGEAAHGVLVLSPHALQSLEKYTPSWPIPRLFRLTQDGKIRDGLFTGKTINTPSMLCVEDCLAALSWAKKIGGQKALAYRTWANFKTVSHWVESNPYLEFLTKEKSVLSPTSVCLKLKNLQILESKQWHIITHVCHSLAEQKVAFDIQNHLLAPPSFRLWCGPTIENEDLKKLLPWIDWALSKVL